MHHPIRIPKGEELLRLGIQPQNWPLHLHVRQPKALKTAVNVRFHLAASLMAREVDNHTITGYYQTCPTPPTPYLDGRGDRLVDFTMTAIGPVSPLPCLFLVTLHMTVEDGPCYELTALYGAQLGEDEERVGAEQHHHGLGDRVFEAWSMADGSVVALGMKLEEIGNVPEAYAPDFSLLTDDLFRRIPALYKLEAACKGEKPKLIIPGQE